MPTDHYALTDDFYEGTVFNHYRIHISVCADRTTTNGPVEMIAVFTNPLNSQLGVSGRLLPNTHIAFRGDLFVVIEYGNPSSERIYVDVRVDDDASGVPTLNSPGYFPESFDRKVYARLPVAGVLPSSFGRVLVPGTSRLAYRLYVSGHATPSVVFMTGP